MHGSCLAQLHYWICTHIWQQTVTHCTCTLRCLTFPMLYFALKQSLCGSVRYTSCNSRPTTLIGPIACTHYTSTIDRELTGMVDMLQVTVLTCTYHRTAHPSQSISSLIVHPLCYTLWRGSFFNFFPLSGRSLLMCKWSHQAGHWGWQAGQGRRRERWEMEWWGTMKEGCEGGRR